MTNGSSDCTLTNLKHEPRWSARALLIAWGLVFAGVAPAFAQGKKADSLSTATLKRQTLEELMNIDITTVAKRPQRWFGTPAAVFVITSDDIRRSGARSIPEVLRLVPGLNVAQIDARQWAISARGFNAAASNKLLVLIDGRSVYTTLFSGVFWDVQDILLENVNRIEVITGPGGTNAVNGIINIISKNAKETVTQPLYVGVGAGIREKLSGGVRYSGTLGSQWSYRVHMKYFDRGETKFASNGASASDSWIGAQAGFRTDGVLSSQDAVTIQGDVYRVRAHQPVNGVATMKGGNLLAQWSHSISENSSFMLKSYFDYTHRRMPDVFGEDLRVFDHELEHRTKWVSHELSWGLGYRHGNAQVINSAVLAFIPSFADGGRLSGFVQDIFAANEKVHITIGSKFVKRSSSKLELQPRISISWAPTTREFLWSSVSRAVRTPSRIDRNLYLPGGPQDSLAGGPDFVSEKLVAIEGGYRNQLSKRVSLDFALFCNFYDDVRSVEPGPPYTIKNGLEARTYGGELVLNTQLASWWNVKTGYSHLQKFISLKSWSKDANGGSGEGNDHKHRLLVQSSLVIMKWEFDTFFRFVDELPRPYVPAYAKMDIRIGWNPTKNIAASILVQNIFSSGHVEFGAANRREIGREAFGKISISF